MPAALASTAPPVTAEPAAAVVAHPATAEPPAPPPPPMPVADPAPPLPEPEPIAATTEWVPLAHDDAIALAAADENRAARPEAPRHPTRDAVVIAELLRRIRSAP